MGVKLTSEVQIVHNVRTAIACKAHGGMRFIMLIKGTLDDIEGAVESEQIDLAFSLLIDCSIYCCAIRASVSTGHLYTATAFQDIGFNPFADDMVKHFPKSLQVAAEKDDELSVHDLKDMQGEVLQMVRETEAVLQFLSPLPDVRDPTGLFPALKLGRGFDRLMTAENLPSIFPVAWNNDD